MTRFLKKKAWLFALLLTATLTTASETGSGPENRIENTILSYNRALIEAAKDPNFLKDFSDKSRFEPFAEEKVAQKLYIWIKSWHENNLYMDAELLEIEFEKVDITDKKAEVSTREIWKYRYFRHVDINRTTEAWPPAKIYYKVKYLLNFTDGNWKIESIKVLSEREEKL
ncbi:hypothetical protein NNO_1402 [Hydrogenimonas sp.]|nr:hypothetical protein NNO_1402 [Hydrogenimonas sp.]